MRLAALTLCLLCVANADAEPRRPRAADGRATVARFRAMPAPKDLRAYLRLEQFYNDRAYGVMSRREAATRPIYSVDVPLGTSTGARIRAEVISAPGFGRFVNRMIGRGGNTARVFFRSKAKARAFAGKLPIRVTLAGQKIPSHATYLVWGAGRPSSLRSYIKFDREDRPWLQVQKAVARTGLLRRLFRQDRPTTYDFLPEPAAILLTKDSGRTNKTYEISLRTTRPLGGRSKGTVLVPLHGALGARTFAGWARRAQMSAEQWVKHEYLPKLGRFLGELGFRNGLWLEAHTQNILLEVNPATGRIARFVFRDLADTTVDTAVLLAHKQLSTRELKDPAITARLPSPMGINAAYLNEYEYLGTLISTFTPHSTDKAGVPAQVARKIFLEHFFREAERCLGRRLPNHGRVREMLRAFGDAKLRPRMASQDPVHDLWDEGGHGLFSRVVQQVYDGYLEGTYARLGFKRGYDQRLLQRAFVGAYRRGRVATALRDGATLLNAYLGIDPELDGFAGLKLPRPDKQFLHPVAEEKMYTADPAAIDRCRLSLEFRFNGSQVLAVVRGSDQVVGVTAALSGAVRRGILRGRPPR